MTMTDEDIERAVKHLEEKIHEDHSGRSEEVYLKVEHVYYMTDKIREFMKEGRREKAMRWLGFAQGVLWAFNIASIDELKNVNRPREENA